MTTPNTKDSSTEKLLLLISNMLYVRFSMSAFGYVHLRTTGSGLARSQQIPIEKEVRMTDCW